MTTHGRGCLCEVSLWGRVKALLFCPGHLNGGHCLWDQGLRTLDLSVTLVPVPFVIAIFLRASLSLLCMALRVHWSLSSVLDPPFLSVLNPWSGGRLCPQMTASSKAKGFLSCPRRSEYGCRERIVLTSFLSTLTLCCLHSGSFLVYRKRAMDQYWLWEQRSGSLGPWAHVTMLWYTLQSLEKAATKIVPSLMYCEKGKEPFLTLLFFFFFHRKSNFIFSF